MLTKCLLKLCGFTLSPAVSFSGPVASPFLSGGGVVLYFELRFYDYICSGGAQIPFLQVDRTSPYRAKLIQKFLVGQHLGTWCHSCVSPEADSYCEFPWQSSLPLAKGNGLEKLACGQSLWVSGLQDQQAEQAWAETVALCRSPPSSQPFCFLLVLVLSSRSPRDFWGLLVVLADAFWASLLASVSSMGRGADGNVDCDGA